MAEETRSKRCTLCKGEHISLAFCEEYKSMDFVNRCRYAIRTARCIKCLRNHNDCPGHLEYPSVSHCEICQATSHHTLVHSPDLPAISVNGDVINTSTSESDVPPPCLYCEEEHLLPDCNGFQTADYEDRFNFCLRMNVCLVCLRPGRICRSTCAATPETACSICGSVWHHALLHEPDKQRRPKGKTSEAKPRCPDARAVIDFPNAGNSFEWDTPSEPDLFSINKSVRSACAFSTSVTPTVISPDHRSAESAIPRIITSFFTAAECSSGTVSTPSDSWPSPSF